MVVATNGNKATNRSALEARGRNRCLARKNERKPQVELLIGCGINSILALNDPHALQEGFKLKPSIQLED